MSDKQPETEVSNTPVQPGNLKSDELRPDELDKVVGGRKAGKEQQEYLKITMNDAVITSTR